LVLPSACRVLARPASLSESNASFERYFASLSRDTFRSSVALSTGVIDPPGAALLVWLDLSDLLLLWKPPILSSGAGCFSESGKQNK